MKQFAIATFVLGVLLSPRIPAQSPPVVPAAQNPQSPSHQQFDNTSLQVTRRAGRWQLWAGNQMMKDLGAGEREANEVLQVLRDLRVTSHASIGDGFDYWLADGQAPSALTRRRQVIPFDPRTTRVENQSGQWVLRDARVVLFTFGPARADAEAALAVCRQYGFDQLGYVGHPTPVFKYLLRDPAPRPKSQPGDPVLPAGLMLQADAGHVPLMIPGVGDVGDRLPFESRRLDIRREGGEWVLYCGRSPVGHFGVAERDARATLHALQEFRVTELCHIGESGFSFFLANGRAPAGTTIGMGARPMRTDLLNVRQVGGVWSVCEGEHPLFAFGERADDANHLLGTIRHYQFDHVIPVGNGRLGNVVLFIKTK
jgi:hypothetical protein